MVLPEMIAGAMREAANPIGWLNGMMRPITPYAVGGSSMWILPGVGRNRFAFQLIGKAGREAHAIDGGVDVLAHWPKRISGVVQRLNAGDLFGARKNGISQFVDVGGALRHRQSGPGGLRFLGGFHRGGHVGRRTERHTPKRRFIRGINAFQPFAVATLHQFAADQHQTGHVFGIHLFHLTPSALLLASSVQFADLIRGEAQIRRGREIPDLFDFGRTGDGCRYGWTGDQPCESDCGGVDAMCFGDFIQGGKDSVPARIEISGHAAAARTFGKIGGRPINFPGEEPACQSVIWNHADMFTDAKLFQFAFIIGTIIKVEPRLQAFISWQLARA